MCTKEVLTNIDSKTSTLSASIPHTNHLTLIHVSITDWPNLAYLRCTNVTQKHRYIQIKYLKPLCVSRRILGDRHWTTDRWVVGLPRPRLLCPGFAPACAPVSGTPVYETPVSGMPVITHA